MSRNAHQCRRFRNLGQIKLLLTVEIQFVLESDGLLLKCVQCGEVSCASRSALEPIEGMRDHFRVREECPPLLQVHQ
jgi:hypothetical protein